MKIYAMSDIHGCLQVFEEALTRIDLSNDSILVLLGDYIHGPDSYGVLSKVISLQQKYGANKVIALVGNHEDMVIQGRTSICEITSNEESVLKEQENHYIKWMKLLPRYFETEHQIFCHAGIDEEADDMWKWGTEEHVFTEKYPAETGYFYKDIIAGHIGTSVISGDPKFHDIFYDGKSHYYIDGTVIESNIIPILMIDTQQNKYYQVTRSGNKLIRGHNRKK